MKKKSFKLIVIGDSGVGKTSLVRRFSKDEFSQNYCMTIGIEFESKNIKIEEENVQLQIWDTVIQQGWSRKIQIFDKIFLCKDIRCVSCVLDK